MNDPVSEIGISVPTKSSRWISATTLIRLITYTLSLAVMKGAMLLFLPLVAILMSKEDVSRYGLYTSALAIFLPLFAQNVYAAGDRIAFDYLDKPSQLKNLNWTLLVFSVLTIAIASVGFVAMTAIMNMSGREIPFLLGGWESAALFGIIAIFTVGTNACQTVMRVRGKAFQFAMTTLARVAGPLIAFPCLAFPLLWMGHPPTFNLLLLTIAIGAGLSFIVSYTYTRNEHAGGHYDWTMLRNAWIYAAPTAVQVITVTLASTSGRWIGAYYFSLEELAEYTLISMLVIGIGGLSRSCIESYRPEIMKPLAELNYREGVRQSRKATAVSLVLVFAFYSVLLAGMYFVTGFQLGTITIMPLSIVLAAIISLIDTLSLYGQVIVLGLKQSAATAVVSLTTAIVSIVATFAACQIVHTPQSLLFAFLAAFLTQMVMYNGIAAWRLHVMNAMR